MATRQCLGYTLAELKSSYIVAIALWCRSWHCDDCRPRLRRRLIAFAASGNPNRLLTLTVRPKAFNSPEEAARALSKALNKLITYLRKRYPNADLQYFRVLEQTKAGWPHFHILMRSPYLPQQLISRMMDKYIASPIVDIRYIYQPAEARAYVAKYLGKSPHRFLYTNRYSWSRRYPLRPITIHPRPKPAKGRAYAIFAANLAEVFVAYRALGYTAQGRGRIIRLIPPLGPPTEEDLWFPPPPLKTLGGTPIGQRRR